MSTAEASNASTMNDPDTPEGRVGIALKHAMVALRRLRGRETHRSGQLSFAQYGLLFGLAEHSPRSTRELATHSDLSPATVTQMLDHMEAQGLVARTRSEEDRRVVLTELTERGRNLVNERHAQMLPRWQSALADFSASELEAAARVLQRLGEYFDALADE
ncbi:MAG: MarR family transcriptional regulator [Solirubrobacterales bacterium]|nr:MarR family transcriptional regulator [Solirubrobacterales bacterium]